MTTYEQQAKEFLEVTSTTFMVKFLRNGKYFEDDKEDRDIYEIILERGPRKYTFNFGQSIANSGKWIVKDKNPRLTKVFDDKIKATNYAAKIGNRFNVKENPERKAPNEYDVLACIQKYEVGTFEDFCSEFGYDTDSRKAERIYNAVKDEWQNVAILWNESELEKLREIQ